MRTGAKKWQVGLAVTAVLAASVGVSTTAHADHVAQLGPAEGGFLHPGDCYVGEEAFSIPDQGSDHPGYFGVALRTTDIKQDVVKDGRTLMFSCKFSDVPTHLRAYDEDGPLEQPGTNPWLAEDYLVPKGGFEARLSCWDRYEAGRVEGSGTIQVSHRGTAVLRCDMRAAYAELDAQP